MTPRAYEIQKLSKIFKKLEKIAKEYKFAFLASGCSLVASHGGGGGGVAPGANWGRPNTGVGVNSCGVFNL